MNPFGLLGIGAAVIGGLVALIGVTLLSSLAAPAIVWTTVLIVVGFASAAVLISSPTLLQRETPPELMGQVSTSATAVPMVSQLFAPIARAALAAWRRRRRRLHRRRLRLALLGIVVLILRPPVGIGVAGGDGAELDVREENAASFTHDQASTRKERQLERTGAGQGFPFRLHVKQTQGGEMADLTPLTTAGMDVAADDRRADRARRPRSDGDRHPCGDQDEAERRRRSERLRHGGPRGRRDHLVVPGR